MHVPVKVRKHFALHHSRPEFCTRHKHALFSISYARMLENFARATWSYCNLKWQYLSLFLSLSLSFSLALSLSPTLQIAYRLVYWNIGRCYIIHSALLLNKMGRVGKKMNLLNQSARRTPAISHYWCHAYVRSFNQLAFCTFTYYVQRFDRAHRANDTIISHADRLIDE